MSDPTGLPAPSAANNIAFACLASDDARSDAQEALRVVSEDGSCASLTRLDLRDAALRCGGGLAARGVVPGDRVAIELDNRPAFAFAWFGALAIGAIAVPLSPELTSDERAYILANTEARCIVRREPDATDVGSGTLVLTADDLNASAAHASFEPVHPDTPAYLVYTSGTTKHPRGVLHGHGTLAARAIMRDHWTGLLAGDRVLHTGRLNWTYTLGVGLMDPLMAGATSVLYRGANDAGTWARLLRKERVTVFATVPTILRQMVSYAGDELAACARTLRHALSAGEPLSPPVHAAWRSMTGAEVYEALGMTECSTYISSGPTTPTRAGSAGRPQPGRHVAVLPLSGGDQALPAGAHGVLAIGLDDPGLMLGYWRSADPWGGMRRGGYFVAGDVVSTDVDGYVTFEGRVDDVINVFGHRVSSHEVESVLDGCAWVREVALVSVQVREDVAIPVAYWVASDDIPGDVEAFAREHLAPYKRPRAWVRLEALPRTRSGKVHRAALRALGVPPTGQS